MKFLADLALDPLTFSLLALVLIGLAIALRLTAPKLLDGVYVAGGVAGAMFLIAILVIIVMNMGARWFLIPFPGSTDYAGYCMAASSCFALAYALNRGAHIRVSLLLSVLGAWRRTAEIWCYAVAALMALVFARYAIKANIWSVKLNEISQGQDKMELWIPQLSMSIGAVLLAVALVDHLVRIIFSDHEGVERPAIQDHTA
jgi:TRAP-type C4-dicarboxylate transport system permease small subunit